MIILLILCHRRRVTVLLRDLVRLGLEHDIASFLLLLQQLMLLVGWLLLHRLRVHPSIDVGIRWRSLRVVGIAIAVLMQDDISADLVGDFVSSIPSWLVAIVHVFLRE